MVEPAFVAMGKVLASDPSIGSGVDAIYQFDIARGGNEDDVVPWVVDLKARKVYQGSSEEADCTFAMADADAVGLMTKTADPTELFMAQKLKIDGDMGAAMNFSSALEGVEIPANIMNSIKSKL